MKDASSVGMDHWMWDCPIWKEKQNKMKTTESSSAANEELLTVTDKTCLEFLRTRDESCGDSNITLMLGPLTKTIASFPKKE
ncbi:hypothetical protein L3X38_018385 [Prunus dulcis]|uniref:Uncharacterized protein n=1 Tax=Prunus dulcis TaxID=3755 RepID=A0AAD4ZBK6_PRUDU|nr:hypothetical protein L3X38_018385 [Prunus dulcis]